MALRLLFGLWLGIVLTVLYSIGPDMAFGRML